tara:strand:- start:62 stop:646 length:585 start_codon:yes stop_codon:yes gene_type:complete
MIQIIDDIIPKSYQEEIKHRFFSRHHPWYFVDDVTFQTEDNIPTIGSKPAAKHVIIEDGRATSNVFDFLHPLILISCDRANIPNKGILQMRSFLQYPLNQTFTRTAIDRLHIDSSIQHNVILYYVCDADGDTIIVDKLYDDVIMEQHLQVEDYNILKRVTPKQGRAVVFDGRYYHTAEQPFSSMRCIINTNISY